MLMASCKDMGATDCDFVAKGNNAFDVKMKMMDHAKMEHKDILDTMDEKEVMKNVMKNTKCDCG